MTRPTFELTPEPARKPRVRRGGWTWGALPDPKLRALSLGAGIQSTTLALMASHGEIGPMPDCAIFADTGDELPATMEHLRWLMSANVLKFPVHVLPAATRLSDSLRTRASQSGRYVSIPAYLDGKRAGQDRRQCTREFKADRLTFKQRELMGYKPRQRIPPQSCEIWIGYSTDEVVRAGPAFQAWAVNRFPLLEMRMSLGDCEAWLRRHDYPVPPRSKCIFCPYRTNAEWRWMRDNDPASFAAAIEIDRLIRDTPGMRARSYLHDSRRPLEEVDLRTDEETGQGMLMICEAGCGL